MNGRIEAVRAAETAVAPAQGRPYATEAGLETDETTAGGIARALARAREAIGAMTAALAHGGNAAVIAAGRATADVQWQIATTTTTLEEFGRRLAPAVAIGTATAIAAERGTTRTPRTGRASGGAAPARGFAPRL